VRSDPGTDAGARGAAAAGRRGEATEPPGSGHCPGGTGRCSGTWWLCTRSAWPASHRARHGFRSHRGPPGGTAAPAGRPRTGRDESGRVRGDRCSGLQGTDGRVPVRMHTTPWSDDLHAHVVAQRVVPSGVRPDHPLVVKRTPVSTSVLREDREVADDPVAWTRRSPSREPAGSKLDGSRNSRPRPVYASGAVWSWR
jgi:hypothetical protein